MSRVNREILKEAISTHIEEFCVQYLPNGYRRGTQWVVGNADGEEGESTRVELEGAKTGFWYDFQEGSGGDFIDLLMRRTGQPFMELCLAIGAHAGVDVLEPETSYARGPRYQTGKGPRCDWENNFRMNENDLEDLGNFRGYSPPFCRWLNKEKLIGRSRRGEWAFPVHQDGAIVSAHIRQDKKVWCYEPELKKLGLKISPLVIGDLSTAEKVFIGESQWDLGMVLDRLGIAYGERIAGIATRSASTGRLIVEVGEFSGTIYLIPQNDEPGQGWLKKVTENIRKTFRTIVLPKGVHDANDYLKSESNLTQFIETLRNAPPQEPRSQGRPYVETCDLAHCIAYDPPANLVLVGNNHIVRGSIFVIGGPPGVGKSRSTIALAIAGAKRVPWLGQETHIEFKTLILQAENGMFRLKQELTEINEPALQDHFLITPPPPYGLCFDKKEFRDQLKRILDKFGPQLVLIDPWNSVSRDDKARDYREAFDLICDTLGLGTENGPAIGIVAHTRKPAMGEHADGRALLHLLAGSYILGSVPRCVWIMQAASSDVKDTRVVWTCCKNNDGKLGLRTAWDRVNGLFLPINDFDWKAFDCGDVGKQKFEPEMVVAWLAMHDAPATRAEIVTGLKSLGMSNTTAYDLIKRAEGAKIIVFDPGTKTYTAA